ncbi:MAG TPA: M1 family metallopeptidase [Chitinophagaceae bacterium]|nr:M1 family metallopeptidase [Chitinophagaceae bacterium]
MKRLLILCSLYFFVISHARSQNGYWQQRVDYTIDVSLNDQDNSLKGMLTLEYTNQSPSQLNFIWFHLWPNAYKNDQTAFAKQLHRDKEGKKRWKGMKDRGYIDSLDFMADGQKLTTEAHPEHIDVVKVMLAKPLATGEKVKLTTPFYVKLPSYVSRMGHQSQSYIICQWYPKPAVYDRKGWHEMPYLDQGEFYSEYGSFKVNITLPAAYVVGATGVLQNQDEYETYKQLGISNKSSANKYVPAAGRTSKTLSYSADNVHDFAWFADKNFIIEYDTLQLASGKVIDVFSYHHNNGNPLWEKSIGYLEDAVQRYSNWIGEYPYPVVAAVEGGKNLASGGMEYPMITHITSPDASEERLDAVITHEVGHNWFYGILGSNERTHAWMDEGINTYYQFRYEAEKYRFNSLFGTDIPKDVKEQSTDEFQILIYRAISRIPMQKPIETHSAAFKDKDEYGMTVYIKTAVWMFIMELNVGKEKLDKAMQDYFNEWKFKHPYPEDLKASLEKSLGINLTPLFDSLKKEGSLE